MKIERIVIHHTGSDASYEQLYNYFKYKNKNMPYHYLINVEGQIIKGVQDWRKGEHLKNKNTGSIGIALIGNYEFEQPNNEMLYHMDNLIWYLLSEYPEVTEVKPHNYYQDTACPGLYVSGYLEEYYNLGRD